MHGGKDMGAGAIRGLSVRSRPGGLVAALACCACACGGTTEPGDDSRANAPPGFWADETTQGELDPALGEIIDVPGGNARDGLWFYRAASRSFEPGACETGHSVMFRVSSFRLMRLEVSNRVYASCVSAGRCAPPDADLSLDPLGASKWDDARRANKPVAVSLPEARAFCRAYGGELPSYHQWVRAVEGDTGAFGIAPLTEAWVRCELGEKSPLCDVLQTAPWTVAPYEVDPSNPVRRVLPDVGAHSWDVGPYGHRDLFGGAAEWVRPPTQRLPRTDCAAAGLLIDEYEKASYEPGLLDQGPLMHLARDLTLIGRLGQPDTLIPISHGLDFEPTAKGQYFTGFRCAFPPRKVP